MNGIVNPVPVLALAPAADYSSSLGYFVTHDGTTATIISSVSTRPDGIIIAEGDTSDTVSVALTNYPGIVYAKAGATCTAGGPAYLRSNGTVGNLPGTAGTYIRVGEFVKGGVSGDLVQIILTDPFNASTTVS